MNNHGEGTDLVQELSESAVSDLIEYFIISGMIMILIIITILTITPVVLFHPADQLLEYTFMDIGNGISNRIVDMYVIAPQGVGNLTSKFDIPDEVVGREYEVLIESDQNEYVVSLSSGSFKRVVSLPGIDDAIRINGNMTGHGLNVIQYNSTGGY